MDNFFDKATHYLGKKSSNVFILNIGAMDGVLFDELIGYTNMYNFKGLYVEPIPYIFNKLKNNIPNDGNLFENSAISSYDGHIEMLTINKEAIDNGLVHNCFYGMSAVYPPKNGLGSEPDKPTVEKYGEKINVNCIKFSTLIEKYNITNFDIIKIDAEGHDYIIFKQIDFNKFRPKVVRLEWINLDKNEQDEIIKKFNIENYKYEITGQDIVGLPIEYYNELLGSFKENIKLEINNNNNKITLVTGLWDIKRNELGDGWNRSYNHYLDKFKQLLDIDNNLIIFGDAKLKEFVFTYRNETNTFFIERNLDWFRNNNYFELIQKIRLNPQWYQQVGWLEESTQAKLGYYNPLVMSKMFLLHDAKIMDSFDSEYMFWIDAGLTNTVHPGYFTYDKVLDKLPKYISKFSFVCFPYETTSEIHGFEINKMNEIAGDKVNKVARGGFFGGPKNSIADINSIYYGLLMDTLGQGYMGTEESLFSIITYKHSDLINYFEIEGNGLFGKFFEDLKEDRLVIKSENKMINSVPLDTSKVGLYVIGFNSPNQFETLVKSMLDYDANFIDKTQKFLLDNSTDLSTTPRYIELCELYGFEHIKKDNLGICGGRQFIAEHFDASDLDVMIFSEDDMNFYNKPGEVCRNGFNRYAPNLYNKCLNIIQKENYDFLKINFSEFYGDNSTQWSWYNVPQHIRIENWPDKPNLPVQGLDPNAPRTKFNNIKSMDGLPYVDGEIYYCNWTHFVTKAGNKKMFIDTKFAHPFENTWMSFMYQETVKGVIKPALLLLTPVEHHRFDHYPGELRREN